MALDAGNVRLGITGALYKAPLGSTLPTDATTALDAAYVDLGYISEDGVETKWEDSVDKIIAWQNAAVVRSTLTESDVTLELTLIETTAAVLEAFHRGSQITEPTTGNFQMDIKPPTPDLSQWVLDVVDGSKLKRVSIGRGDIVERGSEMATNGDVVGYQISIRCYPDLDGNVMQKFSNDSAWG